MPYIGPPAPDRFVAPKAAKQFSSDGSTTAFTLDHAVGSDEDILVSVDGVIQEPSVAYAVSNGTTLTFTAAPSSNSGNNIFVYYLFRTVGTVSHPSNNALTATNGTLTGTLDVTGATTLSSSLAMTSDDPTITMTDSSGTNDIGTIQATSGALVFTARDGSSDGEILFKMSDGTTISDTMRINNGGKVLINTTSALGSGQGVLHLKGAASNTVCNVQTASNGEAGFIFINASGTTVGNITINSSATVFSTSSDYRLKENIVTEWDATTRLKQLKPSRFNFKDDKDTTVDGFIAHEVSSIVPEAITGEKDAVDADGNPVYQGIDQSKLVPLLVKSLQEAIAEIDTLKTKVAALESK